MRDHIFSHENDHRLPVSALSSVAAVEESKNQLSQFFWYGSIFDFGNSIDTKHTEAVATCPLFGDERTSLQLVLRSEFDPDCVKTRMLRFAGAAGWLMKPSLCSDRFY